MLILHRSTISHAAPLLAYLLSALGQKRKSVKDLLKRGAVAVNGRPVTQFDHQLRPGDEVTVTDLQTAVATGRLQHARIQLIYEDDALIVVDKPAGLLTVATDREKTDTLYVHLNEYLRARDATHAAQAFVVHRLDQETSGLVLFAKSASVKQQLQAAWPKVEKTYWAIVAGQPAAPTGTISNYLIENSKSLQVEITTPETSGARLAITHYRLLQTHGEHSLLEVRLQTGRKHQIRVHLAHLGCPVLGDKRYGPNSNLHDRLALHAIRLALTHPTTNQQSTFDSPPSKQFVKLFRM